MHCIVDQKALKEAIARAEVVLDTKHTLVNIAMIKIEVTEVVRLFVTDCVSFLEVAVDNAEAKSPGAWLIPGKPLIDLIETLRKDKVELEVDTSRGEKVLVITNGRSKFRIKATSADEFPLMMRDFSTLKFHALDARDLVDRIESVKFAAAKPSSTQPHLASLFMQEGELACVDGHRLAARIHNIPLTKTLLLPIESISHLLELAKGLETIGFAHTDTHAYFHLGQMGLSIRLMDMQFPDYSKAIPRTPYDSVEVDRQELIEAVRLAGLIDNRQSAVKLIASNGKLLVTSHRNEHGDCKVELACKMGNDQSVGINGDYLLDALARLKQPSVTIELRGARTGVMIKEGDFLCVTMPKTG